MSQQYVTDIVAEDVSDEIFKHIAKLNLELFKECYEYNGVDMGETKLPKLEYHNYLISNPLIFSDPFATDDEFLGDLPESAFVNGDIKSMSNVCKRCYNYLLKSGYTKSQVIGILCNIYQESRFDPYAKNPSSSAQGLCQWLKARRNIFERIIGVPVIGSTVEQQMEFAVYELNNTEKQAGRKIKEAINIEQACYAWLKYFERPGNYEAEQKKRMSYVEKIMEMISS